MARANLKIQVPLTEEPPYIFNDLVRELRFEPGIWAELFDDIVSNFEEPMPISVEKTYGNPKQTIEIRENGRVTSIPLEVTRAGDKPNNYSPLTTPTMATPAIMPKKKKTH